MHVCTTKLNVTPQDSRDWEALTANEQHFISMVLAFFAASDGIVMENLVSTAVLLVPSMSFSIAALCSSGPKKKRKKNNFFFFYIQDSSLWWPAMGGSRRTS